MFFKKLSIVCTMLLIMASCKKENTAQPYNSIASLAFGKYTGECLSDCVVVYALYPLKLQQDTTPNLFFQTNYVFNGIDLSSDKFEQVKHLLSEIPEELTTTADKSYGCPDCHDQGGIYVAVSVTQDALGGDAITTRKYQIDPDDTDDQSNDIISFKTKILTAIQQLN